MGVECLQSSDCGDENARCVAGACDATTSLGATEDRDGKSTSNQHEKTQDAAVVAAPDWKKLCEIPPGPIADLAAASVMLLQPQFIHDNGDDTSRIDVAPWNNLGVDTNGNPIALDPSSVFYGDLKMPSGRSGVMIGPDLVLSAPHANSIDPRQWRVIRGLGSFITANGCQEVDFAHVPNANIFEVLDPPLPASPVVANTYDDFNTYPRADYFAFRLKQPTSGPYLRIRRSGSAQPGDQAVEIDHANRFSTRVSPDGTFYGTDPNTHALLVNGVFALAGSSGGMLYNLTRGYVEGVQANGGGCAWFTITNGIYKLIEQCTSYPAKPNRQIVDVAAQFPAYSLVTAPVDPVTHVAAVGATPTVPTTTYTITAPTTTGGPSAWQLVKPTSGTGEPALSFTPSTTSGTLAPGAVRSFSVTATPGTQCGVYTKTITVVDTARGFTDVIPHRFEIGMTEFTVTPANDFIVEKMAPPYGNTVYSLSNLRPTPVTVNVAPPSFATIAIQQGGQTTPPKSTYTTVWLGAAGSSTATAQVLVNLKPALLPPSSIPLSGDLTFTNIASTCKATSSITRHIQLTPGKQTFEQAGSMDYPPPPPPGSTFGSPSISSMNISDDFTIDSIALDVAFYDLWGSPIYGLPYTKIVLISPAGQGFVVWDRNTVTNPASFSEEYLTIGGFDDWAGVVHVSDAIAPSPVGTQLSPLVGQSGTGTWQLAVYSTGGAPAFIGWYLRMTGHLPCSATTCPGGCCQNGACLAGTSSTVCGTGGTACQTCASGSSCINNACKFGTPCGWNRCSKGTYCCNASCGICAPYGGSCTQQYCGESQ